MVATKFFKSVLTVVCASLLSAPTFAGYLDLVDDLPEPIQQPVNKEIVINANHKITVEAIVTFSPDSCSGLGVVGSVKWDSSSSNSEFKVTEVIKYEENGVNIVETNVFTDMPYYCTNPTGSLFETKVIDGTKYITNHFDCFSLVEFSQEGKLKYDSDLNPYIEHPGDYGFIGEFNGVTQEYDPTSISSRSLYRGIVFNSTIYWFQHLNGISVVDSTVADPDNLEFTQNLQGLAATSRVTLNLANSQCEDIGLFANNYSWEFE